MAIGAPSINSVNDLIFGAGYNNVERVNHEEDEPEDEPEDVTSTSAHANNGQSPGCKRQSMYVDLFESKRLSTLLFI